MSSVSPLTIDDRLTAWFNAESEAIRDSWRMWRELRETSPVHRHGAYWVITPYDLVKATASDPDHFSNDHSRKGSRADAAWANLRTDEQRHAFTEVMEFEHYFMNRNDGSSHRKLRGSAAAAMTPGRINKVSDAISANADAALDRLPLVGEFDLRGFTSDLPLRVICDLVGVPPEDREDIRTWAAALTGNRFGMNPDMIIPAHEGWVRFRAYVEQLVDRYSTQGVEGSDQLVTMLMSAHGSDRLEPVEVVSTFVMLLQGGHETTINLLTLGLSELLKAPEQYRLLVESPELIPNAVEELLRFVSPSQSASRRTLVDTEIDGVPIKANDTVIAMLAAANRDPAVFGDDADVLDVTRKDAKRHVTFSFGPHFCLGTSLARAETRIGLAKLIERYPTLELAVEPDQLVYAGPWNLRRLVELPVRVG